MKTKVLALAKRLPWLIPFLYSLPEGEFRPSDIAKSLGTRSDYVRHCIRVTSAEGLVTRVGEGLYRAETEACREAIKQLNVVRRGSTYIADLGGHYVVLRVRKRYVRVFTVPRSLAERVLKTMEKLDKARASEIARILGVPGRVAYRAALVLEAYGLVEKKGDLYVLVRESARGDPDGES